MDPQAFTDQVSQNFRDLAAAMNFSNDDFIRTTEPRHIEACAGDLGRRLKASGDIYLGSYAGWYSVRDEAFYGEDELTVVDGKRIAPTGAEVRVGRGAELLLPPVGLAATGCSPSTRRNPDFIAPESRRNEVISFVKAGLQRPLDLAAPPSTGASRCRATRRTSCMSGSTR